VPSAFAVSRLPDEVRAYLVMDAGLVVPVFFSIRVDRNFHARRHFYASWIIEQDFNPKRVTELMGHAYIQISFNRHGILFKTTGVN
jgi:integrase